MTVNLNHSIYCINIDDSLRDSFIVTKKAAYVAIGMVEGCGHIL